MAIWADMTDLKIVGMPKSPKHEQELTYITTDSIVNAH